jgi:hypothetical protein
MSELRINVHNTNTAMGTPGHISFDGRNLWDINDTVRSITGSGNNVKAVANFRKLFHENNPLLLVGMTDLAMMFYYFPDLRPKMKRLLSTLPDESYVNNLECFVVNVMMPAHQLAKLCEYAFVLACAKKSFTTGDAVATRVFTKNNIPTAYGLIDGLNKDGRVLIREKSGKQIKDFICDGPLQEAIRYMYTTSQVRDARRQIVAMAYNAWLSAFIEAMIDENNGNLGKVNPDLESLTQQVYESKYFEVLQ